jgi:predicted AlkP superfamily pyrophosphatase or phosphodiesterase
MPSRRLGRRHAAAVAAVALGAALAVPPTTAGADPRDHDASPAAEHVLFVAWDGFDPAYLAAADTPTIDHLARDGSLSTSRGVMTSITNPSWSSVATGAWPERHHNTAYWYDEDSGVARGSQRDIAVPTIAESVRDAGGTVASVQWFILQNHGVTYGDPAALYTQPGGRCATRTDQAIAILRGEPVSSGGSMVTVPEIPDLLTVYCDDLDALGHAGGDVNPEIPARLEEMDALLGELVAELHTAGIADETAIVLTGDHGMTSFRTALGDEIIDAVAEAGYTLELLGPGRSPSADADAVMVVGGVGSLHLVGDVAGDRRTARRIQTAIEDVEHIHAVYDQGDQRRMRMSPFHGELIVEADPGYTVSTNDFETTVGLHGTTNDLEVPLLLSGAGVRNHAPARPRHVDLAPTMAALLGIDEPSGAQGRALREALEPAGR